jgi:hypothetical protein
MSSMTDVLSVIILCSFFFAIQIFDLDLLHINEG